MFQVPDLGELVEDNAHRPAVGDNMVNHHHQKMLVRVEPEQQQAEQRSAAKVEYSTPCLCRQPQSLVVTGLHGQ
jgi:hypothetical protein